jgi:hypothetical protein
MVKSTSDRRRPVHPIFRSELQQAAYNHGFRKENGEADGWLYFRSDEGIPGEVALASGNEEGGAPWFLAVEHAGVAAMLRGEFPTALAEPIPGQFRGAFAFPNQARMRQALSRAFHLARALPTFPLSQFEADVASLGDTEVERITRERIGQGYFRKALLDYWNNRCPLTGISERALLRASHIVPWSRCDTDAQRLDVFNGLLLAAHWDAAFDAGLVSFDGEGKALIKPDLDPVVVALLTPHEIAQLPLADAHQHTLTWHRKHFGFE